MLVLSRPLTSTTGGGVASRTAPPCRSGTCSWRRLGLVKFGTIWFGGFTVILDGKNWSVTDGATTGVVLGVLSLRLIVGTSPAPPGLTGNVENGPSCTFRLFGGRPRTFPLDPAPLLGHAEDTAGP